MFSATDCKEPSKEMRHLFYAPKTPSRSVFLFIFSSLLFFLALPSGAQAEKKEGKEPAKTTPSAASSKSSAKRAKQAKKAPAKKKARRLAQGEGAERPRSLTAPPKAEDIVVPQIDVIGRKASSLDAVPGSGTVIDSATMRSIGPTSAEEVLRIIPGVNVVPEDGVGLRLNVGIRGLDPDRSRRLLMLEDGVPLSIGVYGEPEAYYTPMIDRIQSVELLKGSGSILFGPQTIGGVLNFITRDPPKQLTIGARTAYGSYNYFLAQVHAGNTIGAFGFLVEANHKRFDGHRALNLAQTDITAKFRIQINPRSVFGVKLQFYDEASSATYLGLTTAQYNNAPEANHAINDRLWVQRYSVSATHKYDFGGGGRLDTTFYAYQVTRNWMRQDFDRTDGGRTYDRIVDGNNQTIQSGGADDGSTVYFRNSTGNRNRAFRNIGLESRYTLDYRMGSVGQSEFIIGTRGHGELTSEQRVDGQRGDSPSGNIREDERRFAFGIAGYLQNKFMFLNKTLQITPGFRFEAARLERHILRRRVRNAEGQEVATDLNLLQHNWVIAPIPGLGIAYQPVKFLTIFGGVHRGFAPPRTKDAINNDGENIELEAEYSWVYELGLRSRIKNIFQAEITGFFMDFENQIIPPSESGGAVANDPRGLVNAGRTFHAGLEASAMFDLASLMRWGFRLPLSVSYTWLPVALFADPDSKFYNNRLPYAPEHLVSASLRFFHPFGFSASVTGNYVSQQYADNAMTVQASNDGSNGLIDGRFLLDARVAYTFQRENWSVGIFLEGKNLTNSIFIASRRPQGIQPGMFRQLMIGLHGNY